MGGGGEEGESLGTQQQPFIKKVAINWENVPPSHFCGLFVSSRHFDESGCGPAVFWSIFSQAQHCCFLNLRHAFVNRFVFPTPRDLCANNPRPLRLCFPAATLSQCGLLLASVEMKRRQDGVSQPFFFCPAFLSSFHIWFFVKMPAFRPPSGCNFSGDPYKKKKKTLF